MQNPIWSKSNYVAIWVFLLLNANHEDKYIIWNNKKTLIKKGSFIGSLRKISEYYGISIATVKYIIDYFVSEQMIEHSPNHKFSYFTILNWDKYQGVEQSTEHKVNTRLTQGETTKNDKNVKNDKNTEQSSGIPLVIELFKEINPTYSKWYGNKTQRASVERLLQRVGFEQLKKVIALLPKVNKVAYLPTITTPLQLEDKWASLEAGLTKEKNKAKDKFIGLA